MKTLFIFICLLSFTPLFSQKADQLAEQKPATYHANAAKIERCKKMQKNGIVMICVGSAGAIAGCALFISGLNNDIKQTNQNSGASNKADDLPKMYAGSSLAIIGVLAISAGTSLYLIGKKREKKWSNNLSVVFKPTGFKIAYTF